ncbi:MAG: hypothetical protein Q4A17_09530 [Thermoguttaceae bacterium]|nr:hypothetical protein [Thermoguttaceae bacterium]MDO4858171.1 hypothetical protein [Thermoguttaceae bacterium]
MFKAFTYALGVFILILGFQCHCLKKITFTFFPSNVDEKDVNAKPCEFVPSPGVEYCLYAIGVMTIVLTASAGRNEY